MRLLLATFTFVLSAYGYDCLTPAEQPYYGKLEVAAFSAVSGKLDQVGFSLLDAETKRLVERFPSQHVLGHVRYGAYILQVSAPGFYTREIPIRVARAETKVEITLQVAKECGPEYSGVAGIIRRTSSMGTLWVKLVSLHGSEATDLAVRPDGSFGIDGLLPGDYVLLVLDGSAVVHMETVRVRMDLFKSVSISLP